MPWGESVISWETVGVSSQTKAMKLKADGTPITDWIEAFPEDEVLWLAADDPG